MLEQISLRLSGYLRMINSRESIYVASALDKSDPDINTAALFPGSWKMKDNAFGFSLKPNGTATSSTESTGTWECSENATTITWASGNKIVLKLTAENQCSATMTRLKPREVAVKTFLRITEEE